MAAPLDPSTLRHIGEVADNLDEVKVPAAPKVIHYKRKFKTLFKIFVRFVTLHVPKHYFDKFGICGDQVVADEEAMEVDMDVEMDIEEEDMEV